ncbi:MAG TPA: VCBS repeat-containing protein, partial [Thermoanaerobaculia bacterium]|nr:VCBS repeat-containing protein [Thermoanaerobaculia bacterium]
GAAGLLASLLALATAAPAAAERLRLREVSVELPAAPAAVLAGDFDGDGVRDLAVYLVYTRWDQVVTEELSRMDEVEGLVEVMSIVPALLDRRELWLLRGDGEGGYGRAGEPLPMPLSVHALMVDPGGQSLLALTDDGVAEVVWREASDVLELVPRLAATSRLAGTGVFLPGLELLADVTGDGRAELLFPAPDGLALYAIGGEAGWGRPLGRVPIPAAAPDRGGSALELRYPLPEVRDVTGDGLADLVWRDPDHGWNRPWVAENLGGGRFGPPRAPLGGPHESAPETLHFGDLDGDGRAEVVTQREHETSEDAGMREEIRHAESPPSTLRVFATTPSLAAAAEPSQTFDAQGYAAPGGGSSVQLPAGFRDLDGDGRLDLVTVSLQISITRLLAGLALGRVSLPLDFHVWCQRQDGSFHAVEGLDLSGRFRIDIGELKIKSLPAFAGDFDGDGRLDFVQLGRGRLVTIHTGGPGCRFPSAPDLTVELRREPAHLDLVRVQDLDGDGRADLMIVQPGKPPEPGVTPPSRLDLYLSGGTP